MTDGKPDLGLTVGPSFDRDGYPTEETLRIIADWPIKSYKDAADCLEYCCLAWNEDYGTVTVVGSSIKFVTGGWSGNESVISAMESNLMLNALAWQSSERGGRYVYAA